MAFLSQVEIEKIGFRQVGRGVKLSDRASFHNPAAIEIGDFSRIDDFCVLSAGREGIKIGRNVHISVYCCLMGAERISVEDFSGLSSRVSVYSSNDDYSGAFMTNPTVPSQFTGVTHAPVTVGRHAIVGSGSIILPGVTIGEGASIGALSLINRTCDPFVIYGGIPAKPIGTRRRDLLQHERDFLAGEPR